MRISTLIGSLLIPGLLSVGIAVAQTTPATKPTGTTNRQQELYDQYHGITPKPTTTAISAPVAEQKPVKTKRTRSDSQVAETVASEPKQEKTNRTRPDSQSETVPVEHPEATGIASGPSSGVRVGIRGGATYPVYLEKTVGVDPAIGFVGGVAFTFGSGTVSFQPEINYSRYSIKGDDGFGTVSKLGVDVLEVPLFLKFSSGTYASNRFFVNVGPYGSYAASASLDGKKIDLTNSKGRLGFGAAAGIGLALKAGPGHVTIEVRGLYSLGDTDNGFSTDSKTIRGQGTLGYMFPLGSQ